MRSRTLVLASTSVAVMAAGYTGWWFYAASQVPQRIAVLAENLKASGAGLAYENLQVSGFPLTLRVTAQDVSYTQPDHAIWTAPEVIAEAWPWDLTQFTLTDLSGYKASSLMPGMPSVSWTIGSGHGWINVNLAGQMEALSLVTENLVFSNPEDSTPLRIGQAAIETERFPQGREDGATATLRLSAENIGFADRIAPVDSVIPARLDRLVLDARARGPEVDSYSTAALRQWRDAGGVVEIDRLMLISGKLSLDINGTLTFDDLMRPEAAMVVSVAGLDSVIDQMAKHPGPMAKQAALMRLMTMSLPRALNEEGRETIQLPVTAQDGVLSVMGQNLLLLPPVR